MFFPLSDAPNSQAVPKVTYALIAINCWVWLFILWPASREWAAPGDLGMMDYAQSMQRRLGIDAIDIIRQSSRFDLLMWRFSFHTGHANPLTLITSMFMHGSWMHIIGNMWVLRIFGDNVEAHIGARRYVAVYLGCGVLSTLFFALTAHTGDTPLLGASGAISGILGCYFVWFKNNRVKILMFFVIFFTTFEVPARAVLAFYLVFTNIVPFLQSDNASGGIAYGAHIGGFLAGSGYALLSCGRSPFGPKRWVGPHERTHSVSDVLTLFAQATAVLDFQEAHTLFVRASPAERQEMSPSDITALADALVNQGQLAAAHAILTQLLQEHAHAPAETRARAHLRLGLLLRKGMHLPEASRPHLLSAMDLTQDPRLRHAARQALDT